MLKLLKSLFPILVLTLLLSACGEDPGSSLEENLDSIDLSIDTVQMIVDLPVVGGSQTRWGQKEKSHMRASSKTTGKSRTASRSSKTPSNSMR